MPTTGAQPPEFYEKYGPAQSVRTMFNSIATL